MTDPNVPILKKEVEADDPMEMVGVGLPGDTLDAMAECFIEEYAMLGHPDDAILQFFVNPFYAAPHALYGQKGDQYVRDLISRVRARRTAPGEAPHA